MQKKKKTINGTKYNLESIKFLWQTVHSRLATIVDE